MRTALRIFWRDLRRILRNPIAVVVTIGVCIIPSLYAWFNIAANWNPYANTSGMADDLDTLVGSLDAALGSGDVEQVRTVLSASPSSLASFLSSPVGINRIAVYPIENNGSAMMKRVNCVADASPTSRPVRVRR